MKVDVLSMAAVWVVAGTLGVFAGSLDRAHPLVTVRLNASTRPDDYRRIVEINRRHPGSADEYWFGRCGAGPRLDVLRKRFEQQVPMKAVCEAAGIACGFQQGVTLGHGSIYDPAGGGQAKEELHPFSDDVWQVDDAGNRRFMFCPRSPEVLRYEEKYAALLGETLHPVSHWLDDDLRLGFFRSEGCFCTNCLAAFGAKFGRTLTRGELVSRLHGSAKKDAVRRAWLDFQSESLAIYGASARRGTDRTNPDCLLAYQSVDAMTLTTGRDYAPLLRALSGDGAHPTSIRIGSGCYDEDLKALTEKMLGVAFEVERVRRSGLNLSAVSYEQETYRREAIHKTPEAIAVESALALACGCDAVTEYYWDEKRAEPLWYYEEFAATMSAWRRYFERLAAVSRRTSLGGVARFVGCDFDLVAKRTLRSATDMDLAGFGVPVTVAASGTKVFYVNADSLTEWGEGDLGRLLRDNAVAVVESSCAKAFFATGGEAANAAEAAGRIRVFDLAACAPRRFPTHAERAAMLDAFDALVGAKLPVRVERSHPLYVYPRVDGEGRLVSVTFYNGAAGVMLPTVVRLRRPAGRRIVWLRPEAPDAVLEGNGLGDEIVLTLPRLPARQVGTLFLE